MSMGGYGGGAGSGFTNVNPVLQALVSNVANLTQAFQAAFPRIIGTFTLTANATTSVIPQPATGSLAIVSLTPINAAAALASIYHVRTSNVAGASFSVAKASGTASGTEQFEYLMVNPS